ncbi:PTS system, trehalose-specific IIB component [Pediococcus damnosus]|uniref:PTS system, trehalose-specific IIB component n=1 Tax=Pediococcus damnosus TaxID=51663 RepID=A0AAC9FIZ5_9LACO|nr:PTS transporter subunit EIIC [Pediococcus damnosus]AMV62930.1 PTS system, trehalose-specific IIB component [Pediococcus damnosus]AMV67185.1 PTS system, trehalose-specific IIB component [Pediococcus damnosus]AMV69211.1 PTS system, trehalose-specific IIB component [Pediococcus damnosus]KJU74856.1 PTS beta-glucoside transporter subunit IIABC [Pediococcus damnosus LMG 28219]PIO81034.1 PTS beta-glucoside transporter subunit IIABC [Pediococcus damnosus]
MAKKDYTKLASDIIENIGGKENVKSLIHCITRLRFYLKDESIAKDDVIKNLDGVIDVRHAQGQYQVVIGAAVTDVYDAVIAQLGQEFADPDATEAAVQETKAAAGSAKEPDNRSFGQKIKDGFNALIGVITGSMMPVVGLLAASGILKGLLQMAVDFHWTVPTSQTYIIISAMGDSAFYFLPIIVGFTAAKRLKSDPVIMAIIGGVLVYPSLFSIATGTKTTGTFLGMALNTNLFGLPIHMVNYTYSIFPIIAGAWMAHYIEIWLKKWIPQILQMIFVPLFEVIIVSAIIIIFVGPAITLVSTGISWLLDAILKFNYPIAGLIIGGFYQSLVIFGLHWAIVPLIANDIASKGYSYLNAIVSMTMVAQGAAVLAIFLKSKIASIKELSGAAAISAFVGITEPSIYGINLKYGRAFLTASIGAAAGGLVSGLLNVNMYGFTGSIIGFPSFFTPAKFGGGMSNEINFWIATAVTLVVAFGCTWAFGFKDADVAAEKKVVRRKTIGKDA